jgi:hypothetical protein
MAEETYLIDDHLPRGHRFDGESFALDVYRLLAIVLSDQQIARLGDETRHHQPPVWQLQERFRRGEVVRILISSAVALRASLDQYPKQFKATRKQSCGSLWPSWPKNKRKPEMLTLREACNKIIHSDDIRDDLVIPDRKYNPDETGAYIRPFLYLYGTKDGSRWRAKLSIVDFAQRAAYVFFYWMP